MSNEGEDHDEPEPDMLFGEANEISRALVETVLKTVQQNDDPRIRRLGGIVVITAGIAALGPSAITFDDFINQCTNSERI